MKKVVCMVALLVVNGFAWADGWISGEASTASGNSGVVMLQQQAERSDMNAQFTLGVAYEHGLGVERNAALARKWYEAASSQGHIVAPYHLGLMYYQPESGRPDYVRARQWFEKAAMRGMPPALMFLAGMYRHGLGGERDDRRAVELDEQAALRGYPVSQNSLGLMYSQLKSK